MMKRFFILATVLFGVSCTTSSAQEWQERIFMQYYVEPQGDTVFVDELRPAIVFPKIKKNTPDARKYYKLVYNFNKVYPYTDVAKKLIHEADSTIAAGRLNRIRKDKYITSIQNQLLADFTGVVKKMTVSQGELLIRLVDREAGKTPYDIVKGYKSKAAAGFWQGVAKMFGENLKTPYDPKGADRMTEYLIEKWNDGQFDALYFSVFGEWPPKTEIPSKYR